MNAKLAFKVLKKYDYMDIRDAVVSYLQDINQGKYFPTLPAIISIIKREKSRKQECFSSSKQKDLSNDPTYGVGYKKFIEELEELGIHLSKKKKII